MGIKTLFYCHFRVVKDHSFRDALEKIKAVNLCFKKAFLVLAIKCSTEYVGAVTLPHAEQVQFDFFSGFVWLRRDQRKGVYIPSFAFL